MLLVYLLLDLKDHFFVFKELFSDNSVLMYGRYSRVVFNQEGSRNNKNGNEFKLTTKWLIAGSSVPNLSKKTVGKKYE